MNEVTPIESARRQQDDLLWTIQDIARYWKVGKSTAYTTAADPTFPRCVRIGGGKIRRWPEREVRAWTLKQR